MDKSFSEADSLKSIFLEASGDDLKLLQAISKALTDKFSFDNFISNDPVVIETLAQLHNEGAINVVKSYGSLENTVGVDIDFFLARGILEKLLPRLEAPVLEVMECILHLVEAAGQNLAAGTIINSFVDFCDINPVRSDEALKLIENSNNKLTELLIPTLVAGSRYDIDRYFDKTLALLSHEAIEIRAKAIFALGKLHYSQEAEAKAKFCSKALHCLELSVSKETDDNLLGNIIISTFELYKYDRSQISIAIAIIDSALSKGCDSTLYMASYLLFYEYNELPEALLDKLFSHLVRIKSTSQESIRNIDYALHKLLLTGKHNQSIEFLEKLLIQNSNRLSISQFNQTAIEIFNNKNLLAEIISKWFLSGDIYLCQSVESIFSIVHGDMPISLALSESNHLNDNQIIFIARKAIGYLFVQQPIIATSIIVSLMKLVSDNKNIEELSELLFDPLLINYPGKISDYLKQKLDCEDEKVKSAIQSSLTNLENYFDDLKSTGEIPDLHPPQSQLEANRRKMSRMMSKSMKEAEKKSVFLSILPKSMLLYGRKTINYVHQVDGQVSRIETPLQSYGGEIELPRLSEIDPFGLDSMLRVFQVEKINNHEIDS
jgi:hypothetical protein